MRKLLPLLFLPLLLHAKNELTIPLDPKSPIVIDGVIDKTEWQRSSMLEGMIHYKTNRLIHRDAQVFLASTPDFLYLSVRTPVEDSDPGGGLITLADKDGGPVYNDDCVEFFIGDEKSQVLYQLLFNRANIRLELKYVNRKKSGDWKSKALSAGRIWGNFWEHEVAIPWESLQGINPEEFRFNTARNWVRAGFGYSNLLGRPDAFEIGKMIRTAAKNNFAGVRVYGIDSSLFAGKFCLRYEGEPNSYFIGRIFERGKEILRNRPEPQDIPHNGQWKAISYQTTHRNFGTTSHRTFVPFELGGQLSDGPVSEKRPIGKLGYSFLRLYPGKNRLTVIFDRLGDSPDQAGIAEITSGDGKIHSAPLVRLPDGKYKATIILPENRQNGSVWTGALAVTSPNGEQRYENAFGFTEKQFEWENNKLGISDKILSPFTPIDLKDRLLSTVLRTHVLNNAGLVEQVKSKEQEIFTAPLEFELISDGKAQSIRDAELQILEAIPGRVRTRAKAYFGNWSYQADTLWDYDGLALVNVRLVPPDEKASLDRLTLRASLCDRETTLFHALTDITRGNPAGFIPAESGKAWDSRNMQRAKNRFGQPVIPGEFVPYLWLGGEERGLCFLFDSPRGFDLEDGRPMMRLLRHPGTVIAECDIVNRKNQPGKPIEFSFAFQITPVKPRMPGWKNWVFQFGNRFPGMLHIMPLEEAEVAGMFPDGFRKIPYKNDYSYLESFQKVVRERQADYRQLRKFMEEDMEAVRAHAKKYEAYYTNSHWQTPDRFISHTQMYMLRIMTQHAMTLDRVVPYNCSSIISLSDPAYQYYKVEWATKQPYKEGHSDRIFLTPSAVNYLLWTYDKLLAAGADGINFDEMYVIPQTNPDLSEVRDYKNRIIPETGMLATRDMLKRLAYIMEQRGKKERLISIHLTDTMIVPVFSFATLGMCWEYSVVGNFQKQFPLDVIRANSTGLQAGLVPIALVLPQIVERPKISHPEFIKRKNRFIRTALALLNQHEMVPYAIIFGDYTEQYKSRFVTWAFGTHKPDCTFIPYYAKVPARGVRVSDGFLAGYYQRGNSVLIVLSNQGKAANATLEIDRNLLKLASNAVLMDVATGERFPIGETVIPVDECDFRYLFAGPEEFGHILTPPEPDAGFMLK